MNGFDRARAERAAEAEREAQAVEALARKLRWFRGVSALALAGGVDGERPSAAVGVTLEHVRRRLALLAAEGRAVELGGLWYEPGRLPAPVVDPGRPPEVTHFEAEPPEPSEPSEPSEPPREPSAPPAISQLPYAPPEPWTPSFAVPSFAERTAASAPEAAPTSPPNEPQEVPMPQPIEPEAVPELCVPETREAAAKPPPPPRDPSTWTPAELRAELGRALEAGPLTIRQLVEQLRPGTEGHELRPWCERVRHALTKDPAFVQGVRVGREWTWRLDRRQRPRRADLVAKAPTDAAQPKPAVPAPAVQSGLGGAGTLADIRDILDRHKVLAVASEPDGEYQDLSLPRRVELLARSRDLQDDRVRALQNEREGWRTFFAALWVEAGLGLPDRTPANPDPYDHRGPSGDDLLELVSAGAKALEKVRANALAPLVETFPRWVKCEGAQLLIEGDAVVAAVEATDTGGWVWNVVDGDADHGSEIMPSVTFAKCWEGTVPSEATAKACVASVLGSVAATRKAS